MLLFVGEDPSDARLLEGLLEESTGESFELETVGRRGAALERVAQGNVDVVLLDLSFPNGLEAFAALNTGKATAPFLVLSRVGEEQRALNAVRAGAQDCLVKGRFDGSQLCRRCASRSSDTACAARWEIWRSRTN